MQKNWNDPANENELKWVEIFFYSNVLNFSIRILFLDLIGFNWIQLASIGCNWIEKLHFLFKILNIHNAHKKLILFLDWKRYVPCNSYKWIKMHSELKSIHFNIHESIFLKKSEFVSIHFNPFLFAGDVEHKKKHILQQTETNNNRYHWYNSQHCLCVPTVTNGIEPGTVKSYCTDAVTHLRPR